MSTITYQRRAAAGLCPSCKTPAAAGHVYCAACILDMRRRYYDRASRQAALVPGANQVACCGRFWDITEIPFMHVGCARVHFLFQEKAQNQDEASV